MNSPDSTSLAPQMGISGLSDVEVIKVIERLVGKACDEDVIMAVERALEEKDAQRDAAADSIRLDAKSAYVVCEALKVYAAAQDRNSPVGGNQAASADFIRDTIEEFWPENITNGRPS